MKIRKSEVAGNNKEHIKCVICEATVFLLFWLHINSKEI